VMAAIRARRLNMYPPEINGGDFLQSPALVNVVNAHRGPADGFIA
jgi:hypothetical protein